MKSTKIVAVAVMFLMLSVAGSCILISTESNAGGEGEIESLYKFDPSIGATGANVTACNNLNGKLTSGEAKISMDGTTFVLTLNSIVLDTDASCLISFVCGTPNVNDVKVVINGDCTINQLVKKGEKSSNGGSGDDPFTILSKNHKSFTVTGNGKLNVNVTFEAGAESCTAIDAGEMKIAPADGGNLTLNFNGTAKSSNGESGDAICFTVIDDIAECKNTTINIKGTNVNVEGIVLSDDDPATDSIEGCSISVLGDRGGFGIDLSNIVAVTIKDSNILIDIDGMVANGGGSDDECAIRVGPKGNTNTTMNLDNSSIIAFAPIGIGYTGNDVHVLSIDEKNGSVMSLDCSKNAIKREESGMTSISIKIDNSELEMVAAVKLYDIAGTSTINVVGLANIPVKLGATGIDAQFTDDSDPLKATNKKAFIGYKLDMVFVSEDHTAIIKKERVNANDEYTFTDITYNDNVYSKFKIDGTEYKTGDKYKMTTGVACAQFDCISSGPAPEPEPASSSDFSWPLLIAFLIAILAVAYVGIVSKN